MFVPDWIYCSLRATSRVADSYQRLLQFSKLDFSIKCPFNGRVMMSWCEILSSWSTDSAVYRFFALPIVSPWSSNADEEQSTRVISRVWVSDWIAALTANTLDANWKIRKSLTIGNKLKQLNSSPHGNLITRIVRLFGQPAPAADTAHCES